MSLNFVGKYLIIWMDRSFSNSVGVSSYKYNNLRIQNPVMEMYEYQAVAFDFTRISLPRIYIKQRAKTL